MIFERVVAALFRVALGISTIFLTASNGCLLFIGVGFIFMAWQLEVVCSLYICISVKTCCLLVLANKVMNIASLMPFCLRVSYVIYSYLVRMMSMFGDYYS